MTERFCNQMNTQMHCVFVISTCDKDTHTSHTLPHFTHPPTLGHTLLHWGTPFYFEEHPPTLWYTVHHWAHPTHMVLVLSITFFVRFSLLIILFHEYFRLPISGQLVIDCGFQFCLGLLVYGLMLRQFQ